LATSDNWAEGHDAPTTGYSMPELTVEGSKNDLAKQLGGEHLAPDTGAPATQAQPFYGPQGVDSAASEDLATQLGGNTLPDTNGPATMSENFVGGKGEDKQALQMGDTTTYPAGSSTFMAGTGGKSANWTDPSGNVIKDFTKPTGANASGLPNNTPGIAVGWQTEPNLGRGTLGHWFGVTPRGGINAGQTFLTQKVDAGPSAGSPHTDINYPLADQTYGPLGPTGLPKGGGLEEGTTVQYLGKDLGMAAHYMAQQDQAKALGITTGPQQPGTPVPAGPRGPPGEGQPVPGETGSVSSSTQPTPGETQGSPDSTPAGAPGLGGPEGEGPIQLDPIEVKPDLAQQLGGGNLAPNTGAPATQAQPFFGEQGEGPETTDATHTGDQDTDTNTGDQDTDDQHQPSNDNSDDALSSDNADSPSEGPDADSPDETGPLEGGTDDGI
jgi:hypothetical protein